MMRFALLATSYVQIMSRGAVDVVSVANRIDRNSDTLNESIRAVIKSDEYERIGQFVSRSQSGGHYR